MTLVVRDASEHDLPALVAINEQVQVQHFAERPDQFKPVDSAATERWLRQALENAAVFVSVAELDGRVIGSLVASRQERAEGLFVHAQVWWYVDQIGVLASYRRRGACRALLERLIGQARDAGVPRIELNSWAFNADAQAAFRKLGFLPKHVRFELSVPPARGG